MNTNVTHILREANFVADSLAKNATNQVESQLFYVWRLMPRMTFGYYHLDSYQIPSIRIRYGKAKFFVS